LGAVLKEKQTDGYAHRTEEMRHPARRYHFLAGGSFEGVI
jgi:hypothetical protein